MIKMLFWLRRLAIRQTGVIKVKGSTDRMLWCVADHLEHMRHFSSGPQVHPETGHGTACG